MRYRFPLILLAIVTTVQPVTQVYVLSLWGYDKKTGLLTLYIK